MVVLVGCCLVAPSFGCLGLNYFGCFSCLNGYLGLFRCGCRPFTLSLILVSSNSADDASELLSSATERLKTGQVAGR